MHTAFRFGIIGLTAVALSFTLSGTGVGQAINPKVYKTQFDEKKKDADVVADVRVLSAVCTEAEGQGKMKSVTLQLALQVMDSEKGAKKNDVLVVTHKVNLPAGPGPGSYGYMGALRQFPFTPGVKGSVALRWDKERRNYTAIAGWVPEPNGVTEPREVGAVGVMKDAGK
jgi:hypothetical protein